MTESAPGDSASDAAASARPFIAPGATLGVMGTQSGIAAMIAPVKSGGRAPFMADCDFWLKVSSVLQTA